MRKNNRSNEPKKDIAIILTMKSEFEHFSKVLEERLIKEVKTVAEGHDAILRKLDGHNKRFNDMGERFDKIDSKLVEHDKKFTKVESELQSISMALMETGHETKNHEKCIKKIEEKVLI